MEDLVLPPSQKQTIQTSRRCAPQNKDLWLVVREGSVSDVELALSLLKKKGANVNARNSFGLTPLHIATWRNHAPVVRRLLEAGADPNARVHFALWSFLSSIYSILSSMLTELLLWWLVQSCFMISVIACRFLNLYPLGIIIDHFMAYYHLN